MIIGTYIVLWTPLNIAFLIVSTTSDEEWYEKPWVIQLHKLSTCVAHLNSVANPFIYAYRMKGVRDTVKNLFVFRKSNHQDSRNNADLCNGQELKKDIRYEKSSDSN